jgi:hypothetical protein
VAVPYGLARTRRDYLPRRMATDVMILTDEGGMT